MFIELLIIIFLIGLLVASHYVVKRDITRYKEDSLYNREQKDKAEEKARVLENEHEKFIKDTTEKLSNKIEEIEAKAKATIDERVQKVVEDYEQALKIETEALEKQVAELDEALGEKMMEVMSKNTLYFTCACDRGKQIPCSVDLSSDENYFTCPQCGATYRIVINPSTVLMSGITNNPTIANMYDGKEIGEVERTPL